MGRRRGRHQALYRDGYAARAETIPATAYHLAAGFRLRSPPQSRGGPVSVSGPKISPACWKKRSPLMPAPAEQSALVDVQLPAHGFSSGACRPEGVVTPGHLYPHGLAASPGSRHRAPWRFSSAASENRHPACAPDLLTVDIDREDPAGPRHQRHRGDVRC